MAKTTKKGEQPDAEETEARAWFKENRESSSLTAGDGTELAAWHFAASESTHDYAVCLHGHTNEPIGMARYAKRFHDRGMNVLAPAQLSLARCSKLGVQRACRLRLS
ncbi:MAG: hypothetical protein PUH75_00815 [Collinsella sp.]|nr:hypothetical protein [Collinsella sp.]MDY5437560.1 hypothetical protein [Collinsella sp.]